jgi:lysine decarboxylase
MQLIKVKKVDMKTILMIYPKDLDGKDEIFDEIKAEIVKRSKFDLEIVHDIKDLMHRLEMNIRICAIIYDWDSLGMKIPHLVSTINDNLPIFAISLIRTAKDLNISDLRLNLHFFDYVAYDAENHVSRIEKAINQYYEKIMPPFTKKLFAYTKENKYAYCTPGHLGGSAFLRSPVGSIFYDFYGSNSFKGDISVSMLEMGSLLDHSGPHLEAELFIAKTFNADKSYIVTNGTSASNKIVGMSLLHKGETVLIDRNCHKSITHLLMVEDVNPIYLKPTRNSYGIMGGIPKSEITNESIKNKIKKANQVVKKNKKIKTPFKWPIYAVITNSTYDGIFYNATYLKKNLDVKNIHFDSAWAAYTNFSPIYKDLFGMCGKAPKNKVIYETQSTHKLLAAFSQVSMIHVKGSSDDSMLNAAYMMHTTTSPQYSLVASAEMAAAMMQGNSGKLLMKSSQEKSMSFRHEMKKLNKQNKQGWFFDVWQPKEIGSKAKCWALKSKEKWHGFDIVDKDYLYLDPIKMTVLTPGIKNGKLTDFGIPASIVAKFLDYQGIVVEKTGPYSILFLFSIGIDKAKSLKLLSAFMEFKREFDENQKIEKMLPNLYRIDPVFYKNMRIQTLAEGIHNINKKYNLPDILDKAYNVLPEQCMTPYQAFQEFIRDTAKKCNVKNLKNKICAEMILPYPPGIPLILPGEKITDESIKMLEFIIILCEIGQHFPGFETDIHGVTKEVNGEYTVKIIE